MMPDVEAFGDRRAVNAVPSRIDWRNQARLDVGSALGPHLPHPVTD
jgi:hypothetical protein